jgi:hypothetical protein
MAIKVDRNIIVDDEMLKAHLLDFSRVLSKSMSEVIREQSGLFCMDMIKYSRPFSGSSPGNGATSGAKRHGMENVKKSVYKIFRPLHKATSSMVADLDDYGVFKQWIKTKGNKTRRNLSLKRWVAFKEKNARGNQYAFFGSGDQSSMEKMHTRLREDGGHGPLKSAARRSKQPFAIVQKESDINRYIKKKQESVGRLKSAYYFSAKRLGVEIKAPAWAKNSGGEQFLIAEDNTSNLQQPSITVGNKIGGKAGNDNFVQVAKNHRAFAMRQRMAAELNKNGEQLWERTFKGDIGRTRTGFR